MRWLWCLDGDADDAAKMYVNVDHIIALRPHLTRTDLTRVFVGSSGVGWMVYARGTPDTIALALQLLVEGK